MEGPIVARSVRRGGSLAVGAGVEVATGRGGLAGVGSGWEGFGGSSRFQAIETSPSQRCEVAAARVWAPGEDVKTANRVLAMDFLGMNLPAGGGLRPSPHRPSSPRGRGGRKALPRA